MRVQVAINDGVPVRASLNSKGWLSVHLNFSSDGADDSGGSLWVQAIDYADEPNSTNSVWQIGKLSVGDKAEVHVVNDGEADPPTKVERSAERPTNLFSNADQARHLLSAISACDKELMAVLERSNLLSQKMSSRKLHKPSAGLFLNLTELSSNRRYADTLN